MTNIESNETSVVSNGEPRFSALEDRWMSDRRFRAAFDHAPIGMALIDPGGVLANTNAAFCQMLGYEPGELESKSFSAITHPDDLGTSESLVERLEAREEPAVQLVKRYLHKDGHAVLARVSVSSITNSSGEILQYVAQIEDLTAWKRAEEMAAANEENFRLAFEIAASGMALVDPRSGRFLKVNPTGCRMLGYAEEELKKLTIQDVTAPGDREESTKRFRDVASGSKPSSQAKLHYMRSDGTTAFALVSTALVRDAMGQPMHLVANVVDITQQVHAQDELEEMVASKDELIASVSHELRTPLTAILGFAELLRAETTSLSGYERVELVQTIADQTSDLTNIVEDLLVAARADNESLTVARVSVDLRAQAAQVLETIAHDDSRVVTLQEDTARGLGDPARVRQILRNLISNAFRYGGNDIEVRAYERDVSVCVAVIDDGPGVPEDEWERIFEPYQRTLNRESLTASVGLGLTVSRRLARLMGGDLTYRYEHDRSIFELCLQPDA